MAKIAPKVLSTFRNETSKVEGWLEDLDCLVIHALLVYQSNNFVKGDLLEIGVYQGKSAILLGMHLEESEKLHVCDIFDNHTDEANQHEIDTSYSQFSLDLFLKNYLKVLDSSPEVYSCASSELTKLLPDIRFRLIHIDGSHLYEHVSKDLSLAASVVYEQQGIIIIDDFRAEHASGVSNAMWEMIFTHHLRPIIFTRSKAYLVPVGSILTLEATEQILKDYLVKNELVYLKDYVSLRAVELNNPLQKSFRDALKRFLPPIIIEVSRAVRRQRLNNSN